MTRTNPYIFGPAVRGKQFIGRAGEINVLTERIIKSVEPSSCSVVGETRVGKSSLLNKFVECAEEQNSGLLFLKYDVSTCFHAGTTVDFYRQLISLVQMDLSGLPDLNHEAAKRAADPASPWPIMIKSIKDFFRSVRSMGHKLVLVLDEFDFMTEHFKFDPQGWKVLRSLGADDYSYRVVYLTASRRSIEVLERDAGISSNFNGIFGAPIRLNLMSESESAELISKPANEAGLFWTESQYHAILNAAGRHPYCLQMTCFYLFARFNQNALPEVIDGYYILKELGTAYRNLFDLLRDRLQHTNLFEVLLKIAHGVPSDSDASQVDELIDLGYIVKERGEYNEFSPFSLALDYYLKAFGRTQSLWPLMEQTELALRSLVENRYKTQYGDGWIDVIRRNNPGRPAQENQGAVLGMIEKWEYNKKKELKNPFACIDNSTSLIHFSFTSDLKQLIDQQWAIFQDIFPWRKRELDDRLDVLTYARNPSAHYRRISNEGATRSMLCCQEILRAILPHL